MATFVLRCHCRRPHPASPHASSLLRGHLQQSVSPGAGPAAAAGGWEVARCTRHVQGAVPAEPGRGRGRRPRAAENELCSSLLGRSPRAGVPSPSPSPIGDAEVRRGWVTSPCLARSTRQSPGSGPCPGPCPGPLASHAGQPAGQGQPRSGARDASMEMLVLAKAPGKLQGVKRHPGPGHDARPVPAIPQTLSLSRRTRRWALACTPLPRPPAPPSHTAVGERRRPKARPGALHQASRPPGGQRREGPGHLLSCGPWKARLAVPRRAERLLSNASLGGQHMSTPGHTRGTLSGAHATHPRTRARAHTHPAPARAADGPVPRLTVSCPSRINAISCTHHY